MTKEELAELLKGEDLLKTIDVKTLVLDLMREMPQESFEAMFWERLEGVTADRMKDYFYMRRG